MEGLMSEYRTRFMSREEAGSLLKAAGAFHRGEQELPPEILAKRAEIAQATRKACLFMAITGKVDNTMVFIVVDLKLELDSLFAEWGSTLPVH